MKIQQKPAIGFELSYPKRSRRTAIGNKAQQDSLQLLSATDQNIFYHLAQAIQKTKRVVYGK